jgi:hypothetical protein
VAVLALIADGVLVLPARTTPALHYQTLPLERGPIEGQVLSSGTLSALVSIDVASE